MATVDCAHGLITLKMNEMKHTAMVLVTLLLGHPMSAQQQRTKFNGFWIGMTIEEFRLTDKGRAIVEAYRKPDVVHGDKSCDASDNYVLGSLCDEWDHLNNKDIGFQITLSDPKESKLNEPVTLYEFNEFKLQQIDYNTAEVSDAGFSKTIGLLSAKYGKPTRAGTLKEQNEFGAITYKRYAQWDRPDGVTIQADVYKSVDADVVVRYFIPVKQKPSTKNPY